MVEVRLCNLDELVPGSVKRFDVADHKIAVVRINGEVYAIDDTCSHGQYSLSEGEVWTDEREIECPKHGSTFSLITGEPQSLPATQPVAVYPVRVDGGDVYVELAA
ncbi:MAG: ferredoxin subunit of nitrite reductase and ring-hydroxylating dioxygenase [Actinomycetia bacterium]|nr:ferredoxin subunit of nitrite reductase and ring-hydroxylating dioxygenase [Actinomycetes bacterium]